MGSMLSSPPLRALLAAVLFTLAPVVPALAKAAAQQAAANRQEVRPRVPRQVPAQGVQIDLLGKFVDQEFRELRRYARGALSGLMRYPNQIRNALLEVCQHPEVVDVLVLTSGGPVEQRLAWLRACSRRSQQAAMVLAKYSEVLAILREYPLMTRLAGLLIAASPKEVSRLVTVLGDQQLKALDDSIQGWAARLSNRPAAVRALVAADARLLETRLAGLEPLPVAPLDATPAPTAAAGLLTGAPPTEAPPTGAPQEGEGLAAGPGGEAGASDPAEPPATQPSAEAENAVATEPGGDAPDVVSEEEGVTPSERAPTERAPTQPAPTEPTSPEPQTPEPQTPEPPPPASEPTPEPAPETPGAPDLGSETILLPERIRSELSYFDCEVGFTVDAADAAKVTVYALPPAELVMAVLDAADEYVELAEALIDQWRVVENPAGFQDAVASWWSRHASFLPESVLASDQQRASRLRELAVLKKRAQEMMGAEEVTPRDLDGFFKKHALEYPFLTAARRRAAIKAGAPQGREPPPAGKMAPAGNRATQQRPAEPRGETATQTPVPPSTVPAAGATVESGPAARSEPQLPFDLGKAQARARVARERADALATLTPAVTFEPPSFEERLEQAISYHRQMWSQPETVAPPPSVAPGPKKPAAPKAPPQKAAPK
ncbi:MAG: hypothetical protein AB1486_00485 [Planctomycetota bacterium]